MNRSLLSHALYRGADGDGGAADLQTDVMRFMAILSLCLVAIFALVQSIPLAPAPPMPPAPPAAQPAEPPAEPPPPEPLAMPAATPAPPPPAAATPPKRPAPMPLPDPPSASPAPAAVPPAASPSPPAEEGFTLAFESDRALTRLVERHTVGLYALLDGRALRLSSDGGRLSFWSASQPTSFHEMDPSTVPEDVRAALGRAAAPAAGTLKWAVTLPAAMARDLETYLREHTGGRLVIGADGRLRLER